MQQLKKAGLPAVLAIILFFIIIIRLSAESAPSVQDSSADVQFTDYTMELFRQEVSANPFTLRYTLKSPEVYGITEYSTDPGTYSAENVCISAALAENVTAALLEFDPDALSSENRLTLDVLLDSMQETVQAASFPYYEEPLRPSTGAQTELPILLAEYAFSDKQDIDDYLEILDGIPAYLDSICVYEREKQDQDLFMADFAAEAVISQCEDFAASGEDNYLIYTFEERTDDLEELTENEKTAYREQNQAIVSQSILPAYQDIADTLRELNDTADADDSVDSDNTDGSGPDRPDSSEAGLCYLPLGTEYYTYLIRQNTGSPDSVRALKKRVEEQRASDLLEIAALLEEFPELESELLLVSAPCDTPEEMLKLLRTQIAGDFPVADNCSYTVKYVDAAMEEYLAPAFYLTSPLDDFSENSIYINNGNGHEGIRLFTTLAHEGFPGHLYQNTYFNGTDPDPIRALFGPAGYSEGWATYVELLSYRYAGLSDELAKLLALEQSATLSLYATADLYIHSEGWTFADTLDFFSGYGFSDGETIRDVFELIAAEPTHYLKYYIGYLEFLDLKGYTKELFGKDYTDLSFHRAILEMGPAPFDILAEYLPDFYTPE